GLVADLERAQRDWDRETRLIGTRASTASQAEASQAGFLRLREQVEAARARWQMLKTGSRAEDIAEARAERARADAQAELLERGTRAEDIAEARARVAELRAKIREADSQLREAVVLAPEDVLVEIVSVRPGDTVAACQTVARV